MLCTVQIRVAIHLPEKEFPFDTETEEEALAVLLPIWSQAEGQIRKFAKDRKESKIDLKQSN